MSERLQGEELVALIERVFQPRATDTGIAVLVERGFGLGGLTGQERVQLFGLLEKVRLGHGDFGLATQATQP